MSYVSTSGRSVPSMHTHTHPHSEIETVCLEIDRSSLLAEAAATVVQSDLVSGHRVNFQS